MRLKSMVVILVTFVLTSCWNISVEAKESLKERIDRLAQPYLENDAVVGMTIGVLHEGKKGYLGYGRTSKDDDRMPDGKTIYEIGSMSKLFTGLLLADAVVERKVKLDEPAGELLPAGVEMPSKGKREITLKDLSTHVSGLPRLPENLKITDPTNPYASYTAESLYEFLNDYELTRKPGEKGEYSNLGVGLLGHLLSLHGNATYEHLLQTRIAEPLKMTNTVIRLNETQQKQLAAPHLADGRSAANWDLPTLSGAGAIRSSASDLLRFASANLDPPKNKLGEAIELAWEVHQEPLEDGDFAIGLGWHIARDGSTRWHNGQTGGYHSMMLVNRELEAAVVVLTNTATGEVDKLAQDIIQMLAGVEVQPREFEKMKSVPEEIMKRYVGKYELAPDFVFTVSMEDGKLLVGVTGQGTHQVYPRTATEWFYKVVKASLKFDVDKKGKCNGLELHQNGIRQKAKRIE